MKKTLLITLEFPPFIGGVANHLYNFCNNLDKDKIVVLANSNSEANEFDSKQQFKIIRKNFYSKLPIWPKWLPLLKTIKQVIKENDIEYIIAGQILPVGTLAMLAKLPYIVMTYAMDVTILHNSSRRKKIAKKVFSESKKVVTISNYTKNQLVKLGIAKEKIELIYPCPTIKNLNLDEDKIINIKNKYNPDNKKIILTTGRLVERKGQDMVIKSLKKVISQIPDVLYLIGGKGEYQEDLELLVKKNQLEKYVKFIGFADDDELPYLYNLCDVFIMASRKLADQDVEGFGIVFLEANLFEKPVIGGNSGGIPDAVEDNYSGVLVDPNNEDDIANSLIKLFTNKELAQKLGQQGKTRAMNEFRWDVQAKKLEKLLND